MHETTRIPTAAGRSSPAGAPSAEKTNQSVGRRASNRRSSKFSLALGGIFPEQRLERFTFASQFGSSSLVGTCPEATTDESSDSRPFGLGLLHGPLDPKTHFPSDPEEIPRSLSPQPHLALASRVGLELSEAGEKSSGEKREGHPAVETEGMAAYKKTLNDWGLVWRSSTKAASFWSPTLPKPGRPEAKLRSCVWPETGRRYRQSPPLRSAPNEKEQRFISVSIPTKMFAPFKSVNFCDLWLGIFRAPSFSCGTEARLTARSWFRLSCAAIPGFIPTSFRAMHPNSTRTNLFGVCSNDLSPTWSQRISCTLNASFGRAQESSRGLNGIYGLAFTHPTCLGDNMLHYLYKGQ